MRRSRIARSAARLGKLRADMRAIICGSKWGASRIRKSSKPPLRRHRAWTMFDLGWTSVVDPACPLIVGATVGVLARVGFVWTLNACRILEVFDEPGRRLKGFWPMARSTNHAEGGEERFLRRAGLTADRVWFDLLARVPSAPLVRPDGQSPGPTFPAAFSSGRHCCDAPRHAAMSEASGRPIADSEETEDAPGLAAEDLRSVERNALERAQRERCDERPPQRRRLRVRRPQGRKQ